MTTNTELKPCPFCGGKAEIEIGKIGAVKDWYYVGCQSCTGSSENPDWNTRPVEDSLRAENEKLRGLIGELVEDAMQGWGFAARGTYSTQLALDHRALMSKVKEVV